jgi:hypothetical protein
MGGEWSASCPGRALPPGKGPPVPTVHEAGWAPEPVWTQGLEEKSSALVGGRNPIVQPVDRHYTDWATAAAYTVGTGDNYWKGRFRFRRLLLLPNARFGGLPQSSSSNTLLSDVPLSFIIHHLLALRWAWRASEVIFLSPIETRVGRSAPCWASCLSGCLVKCGPQRPLLRQLSFGLSSKVWAAAPPAEPAVCRDV